ncbi:MAG: glycoside hydrolase family 76 protein [Bacteroidota bacterium]
MKKLFFLLSLSFIFLCSCSSDEESVNQEDPKEEEKEEKEETDTKSKAEVHFDQIFSNYWSDKVNLLYGNYPNPLGSPQEPTSPQYDVHAYLWGFGGVLSAFNAVAHSSPSPDFFEKYEEKLKTALLQYYTPNRNPIGFACFVNSHDERLYDDAIWVGIDLVDLYMLTKDEWYLDYAKIVWDFVMTGHDDVLGGGIYWKEAPKNSKNTCSNAPAVVLAAKLYEATDNQTYLDKGKEIYTWVKNNLQDPEDNLYWDNMKLDGTVETWKFSYNSGQMLQAGVLLYNATENDQYLNDATLLAEACFNEFFDRNFVSDFSEEEFPIIKDGHVWFNAVMVRGFIELEQVEKNSVYMNAIRNSLEHGLKYAVDSNTGLLKYNLSGRSFENPDQNGDILFQGAFVEMLARFDM